MLNVSSRYAIPNTLAMETNRDHYSAHQNQYNSHYSHINGNIYI